MPARSPGSRRIGRSDPGRFRGLGGRAPDLEEGRPLPLGADGIARGRGIARGGEPGGYARAAMARLVLVHGAFGGAWVWAPVLDALRAAGHTPEPIDLPGAGEDQTPVAEVTLDAYGVR